LADISPIRGLLDQGCDLEADGRPIVPRDVPDLPRPLKNWGAPWLVGVPPATSGLRRLPGAPRPSSGMNDPRDTDYRYAAPPPKAQLRPVGAGQGEGRVPRRCIGHGSFLTGPLSKMMKPGIGSYDRFKQLFDQAAKKAGKQYFLIPILSPRTPARPMRTDCHPPQGEVDRAAFDPAEHRRAPPWKRSAGTKRPGRTGLSA
jgi:hypothetical protein